MVRGLTALNDWCHTHVELGVALAKGARPRAVAPLTKLPAIVGDAVRRGGLGHHRQGGRDRGKLGGAHVVGNDPRLPRARPRGDGDGAPEVVVVDGTRRRRVEINAGRRLRCRRVHSARVRPVVAKVARVARAHASVRQLAVVHVLVAGLDGELGRPARRGAREAGTLGCRR